jgi:hypothetical protein
MRAPWLAAIERESNIGTLVHVEPKFCPGVGQEGILVSRTISWSRLTLELRQIVLGQVESNPVSEN